MVTTHHTHTPAHLEWPPDDTEESILGLDRHQLDIITVRTGINEAATGQAVGGPLPWQALSQLMLLGLVHPSGTPYVVYPDVFVFPHPVDRNRGSYGLAQDGAPVLVIEVASESTYEADLDLERGKAWTYQHAGVAEYLVLDPPGTLVPGCGRGWRLEAGRYAPWPAEGGRWRSLLGLSFGVEDGLAAVYGPAGRRYLREGEVEAALAQRDQEVARLQAELNKRDKELSSLRRLTRLRRKPPV